MHSKPSVGLSGECCSRALSAICGGHRSFSLISVTGDVYGGHLVGPERFDLRDMQRLRSFKKLDLIFNLLIKF